MTAGDLSPSTRRLSETRDSNQNPDPQPRPKTQNREPRKRLLPERSERERAGGVRGSPAIRTASR